MGPRMFGTLRPTLFGPGPCPLRRQHRSTPSPELYLKRALPMLSLSQFATPVRIKFVVRDRLLSVSLLIPVHHTAATHVPHTCGGDVVTVWWSSHGCEVQV